MLGAAIAVGLGLAGAGAVIQADAAKDVARGQRDAERIRQRQMAVQADRERRQAIRAAMQARAGAMVGATAQGAQAGSGIAGGVSQVVSDAGRQVGDTNINEGLGNLMFAANALVSRAQSQASIGQAVGSLGSTILGSSAAIGRVGGNLFGGQQQQSAQAVPNGLFGGVIGFGGQGR